MQLTTLYRQQDGFMCRVEPGSATEARLLSSGFVVYQPPDREAEKPARRRRKTEKE